MVESSTIEDARTAFEGLEIVLEEEIIDEAGFPTGVVVRQEPPGFSEVTVGATVTLFVSEGPDQSMVAVPLLLGKTEAEAIDLLREYDLTAGLSLRAESTTYSESTISRQSIAAGELVERGTEVVYTISTGSPAPPSPLPDEPTPEGPGSGEGNPEEPPVETPAPTPVPTPAPEPLFSGVLEIGLWDVGPEVEEVYIQIIKIEGNRPSEIFFEGWVPVSNFPLRPIVTGMGPTDFAIYSIDNNLSTFRFHATLFND
jgi:hypothetical protein